MPEGPSIVILKEQIREFKEKKVLAISGNTKVGLSSLVNQKIIDFKSFGKNFFICFINASVKIHFMLFGSYRINERKEATPRLSIQFKNGELNFYACSVKLISEDLNKLYDWRADVMNESRNAGAAIKKLKEIPGTLVVMLCWIKIILQALETLLRMKCFSELRYIRKQNSEIFSQKN
jgi:endonuclease-8